MHRPSTSTTNARPEEDGASPRLGLARYLELYRAAAQRLQSETAYRRFQAFQAAMLLDYMRSRGVALSGRLLVDLGSGVGGYSEVFAAAGARVLSLDLMAHQVRPGSGCQPVGASATAVPLATSSVDVVFCASLIEHVAEPAQVVGEIERILVPGGYCYLSFPPFYSPRGGHEYAPFHYLGEKLAIRLTGRRAHKYHPAWAQTYYPAAARPASFAEIYAGWGLYVMTVGKARRLLAASEMAILDLSTRYMPYSFIRWPLLGELLTWHAQFLLRKPA